jgi:hypothetical protein
MAGVPFKGRRRETPHRARKSFSVDAERSAGRTYEIAFPVSISKK